MPLTLDLVFVAPDHTSFEDQHTPMGAQMGDKYIAVPLYTTRALGEKMTMRRLSKNSVDSCAGLCAGLC